MKWLLSAGEKAKSGYFIILDDISKVLIESMMLISVFVICCGAKTVVKIRPAHTAHTRTNVLGISEPDMSEAALR